VTGSERLIVVIHDDIAAAQTLKELIEFMDAPDVRLAKPDDWRATIGEMGDRRLAAVFVADELSEAQVQQVFSDLGRYDPNVPIVMINGEPSNA
jgi:hypothetical protein